MSGVLIIIILHHFIWSCYKVHVIFPLLGRNCGGRSKTFPSLSQVFDSRHEVVKLGSVSWYPIGISAEW